MHGDWVIIWTAIALHDQRKDGRSAKRERKRARQGGLPPPWAWAPVKPG